jgi:cysteine-rich repeat protein
MRVRVRASFYGGASQSPPLLALDQQLGAPARTAYSGSFRDPFPADWPRSLIAFAPNVWNYAARGSLQPTDYGSSAFERHSADYNNLTAPLAAPRAIKINHIDTSQAAAISFDGVRPVTVEWNSVVGVGHYRVLAMRVFDAGQGSQLTSIATFDTNTPSVAMPASLFKLGDSYVVTVTAIFDPTTDYAGGVLRLIGFPDAMREAATARLLFAASCGNGLVDAAYEECDSGGISTATCNPDCTAVRCGDGFVNAAAGEVCDDAGDSLICNRNCSIALCGDGILNFARGESCDDHNTVGGDGCSSTCHFEVCGNRVVDPGESCDLGPDNGQLGACCSSSCSLVPPASHCP